MGKRCIENPKKVPKAVPTAELGCSTLDFMFLVLMAKSYAPHGLLLRVNSEHDGMPQRIKNDGWAA